jgi:fibrillarin-like pre-rRNA processing protein
MSRPINIRGRLYTPNADEGRSVYGEKLRRLKGKEHREWSVRRSKLAAYAAVGGRRLDPGDSDCWLYLGAASGTTVSHVADLVPEGVVVAVEFAVRPFHDLLEVAARRPNVLPVLADAADPGAYAPLMERRVDVVYQDIAQRSQADLFVRNLRRFLRPGGLGFLAVKARSIDVAADPAAVFRRVKAEVTEAGWTVLDARTLDPWQKDHAMLVVSG